MIPSMDSPNPLSRILSRLETVERLLEETRSSMGTLENATIGSGGIDFRESGRANFYDASGQLGAVMGAAGFQVIDPATGGTMIARNGRLYLYDSQTDGQPGQILCDQGAGVNVIRLFPPSDNGSGLENSFTVQGRRGNAVGNAWLYTDGQFLVSADGSMFVDAGKVQVLTGGEFGLYELPTTSSAANLRLDTIGGKFTVGLVSSSRRYKVDIEDAAVDPREVIQLRGRSWRDRHEVEVDPDTTKRSVGFVAEELDEHPTLRQYIRRWPRL